MHATTLYNSVAHFCLPAWDESHVADLSARLADFSRMQPEQPNPWHIVAMISAKMVSAAGAKEAELQGASSVMRGNAVAEAMQGET
jgi:hypothetical protein